MERRSDPPGVGLVLITFGGFFVIVIFAAALGGYIGRHSTPETTEAVSMPAPAPSVAPPESAPPAAAPAPAKTTP